MYVTLIGRSGAKLDAQYIPYIETLCGFTVRVVKKVQSKVYTVHLACWLLGLTMCV